MRHILVVDDEPAICELIQLALEADGSCRVTCTSSAGEAVTMLRRNRPDAAIIDAVLPQVSGLQLVGQALDLGVPVLIVTGELATRARLEDSGCPYLAKPFAISALVAETKALLYEAPQRRAQLAVLLPRLIGKTLPLRMAGERVREARRKRVRRAPAADLGR
jgi:DNA-binding response OmpR family regulator